MKILKYLLFLILIVLIGGAIYFATQDGKYDISDSKIINAPSEILFSTVNEYKTWELWGPWKAEDSTMTFTYAEKTSGEGASYSWDGAMAGAMTTTKVIPNKEILQNLTLHTPGGERNPKVYWKFDEVEGGTKLTWGMNGEHTLMDKAYYQFTGTNFEHDMHKMNLAGLEGIEKMAVEEMKKFSVNVDGITQLGGSYYMYNTTASKMSDIGAKMGAMMGQVMTYMQTNGLQINGMPFTIYNNIDEANNSVIFSTAIPVREKVIVPSGSEVLCGYMPPLSALKTTLKGNYDNLSKAYEAAGQYIAENNLQPHPTAKMFEIYVSDPGLEPNPANWVTEVFMPLQTPNN